jgi:hypothetical protein
MTNLESFDAESATEPTTKRECANANMSAGAEMLIERMKTNPEDFKYGGKFYRVVDAINAKGQGWISERDYRALALAYQEHIQEAEFSEWVYGEIFNPKEPEPVQNLYAQMQGQRAQMQNAMLGTQLINPVMTMSNSGNVGVGTAKPGSVLTVNANSGNPTLTLGNTALTETMLGQIKNKLGL